VVQRLSLNAVIEETAALLRTAVAKRATLHLRLEPNLPAIEADATQIRQVVMNLIINASEAIGEQHGTITLSTSLLWASRAYLAATSLSAGLSEGEYVALEVVDTGAGMDAETLSKIFHPFFTTKFTGRGLGLAAVQGIVRQHKGTLKVRSRVGQGTSFTILFPRSESSAESALAAPRAAIRGHGRVLIIDDEEHVRAVTSRMLERFGFEVLLAASGAEAIELVRARPAEIDCILLDMTMPQLSSEETFRQIRALDPRVRVVLMSGYSEQEVAGRFDLAGLAGFLHKPFSAHDLQERIQGALGGAGPAGTERA
jgi:two-component system, cell cycle sensor histidine kinase and response regulator CckA